ncbi:TPA: hypothetical protein ACSCYS_003320 [Aeromonas veronii]|nr:hypothetical protein [Aeromonas veronii]
MNNRDKLLGILADHKITQAKCAEIICMMSGRPCSVRAVRSWVNDPSKPSIRTCPDWVISLLNDYFANNSGDNSMNSKESSLNPASLENVDYQRLLEQADVKEALARLEVAQSKRDSVSRKASAGSEAVSEELLEKWEREFLEAKAALEKLAEKMPLLNMHPVLSKQ